MHYCCLASIVLALLFASPSYSQKYRNKAIRNVVKAANYRGEIRLSKRHRYGSLNVFLNSMNYFGDLSPTNGRLSTDFSTTSPAFAISYGYKMGANISYELRFRYGTITGSDAESARDPYRLKRNLSFKNHLKDLSAIAVLELFRTNGYYIHRPRWTPYALIGIGVVYHNPLGQEPANTLTGAENNKKGRWVELKPLGTEGQYSKLEKTDANFGIKPYRNFQPTIPVGLGVSFRLNERFDMRSEFYANYFFTDYLDDVSRNYVDLGVLKTDLARTMSYRTNEIEAISNPYTYVGRDGNTYTVEAGYGSEHKTNIRGQKKWNDAVFSFSVGLRYIVGAKLHQARSR